MYYQTWFKLKILHFFLFLNIYLTIFCFGQAKQSKYADEGFDGGLVYNSTPAFPMPMTQKPVYMTLLKYSTKDVYAGNLCVLEQTRNMGFEYLVMCNPKVSFGDKIKTFFYNFGTNITLTTRNGFGWKKRLKTKVDECRKNSGDYVW